MANQLDLFRDVTIAALTGKALEIKEWIDGTIPPGLPSYVLDILNVRPGTLRSGFGGTLRYSVDMVVFDGKRETMDVSPARPGGGGCCQWHQRPHGEFHWDEDVRAWVRLPAGWMDHEVAA